MFRWSSELFEPPEVNSPLEIDQLPKKNKIGPQNPPINGTDVALPIASTLNGKFHGVYEWMNWTAWFHQMLAAKLLIRICQGSCGLTNQLLMIDDCWCMSPRSYLPTVVTFHITFQVSVFSRLWWYLLMLNTANWDNRTILLSHQISVLQSSPDDVLRDSCDVSWVSKLAKLGFKHWGKKPSKWFFTCKMLNPCQAKNDRHSELAHWLMPATRTALVVALLAPGSTTHYPGSLDTVSVHDASSSNLHLSESFQWINMNWLCSFCLSFILIDNETLSFC